MVIFHSYITNYQRYSPYYPPFRAESVKSVVYMMCYKLSVISRNICIGMSKVISDILIHFCNFHPRSHSILPQDVPIPAPARQGPHRNGAAAGPKAPPGASSAPRSAMKRRFGRWRRRRPADGAAAARRAWRQWHNEYRKCRIENRKETEI